MMVAICMWRPFFLTMAINLNEVKAVRKLLGMIMPTFRHNDRWLKPPTTQTIGV